MKGTRAVGRMVVYIAAMLLAGGCTQQKNVREITVLLRMMPAQERFLRQELIPEFEKTKNCRVNVATFENEWDIERVLKLEAGKVEPQVDVVKTPFEMVHVLASKGYMAKITQVADSSQVMQELAEYHPLAAGLGYVEGNLYYLPRKLETRILFYRKSMVADAVKKFEKHKSRIVKELKAFNGVGLPADYVLEADPALWDYFDVYVVGSIWANEEYNGVNVGRIAHRGAHYGGTALTLVDMSLQLGATKEEIISMSSDEIAEMFLWENIMVQNGVFNPGMWQDKWKGSDIYNGIKDGKVFLALLQQIDCFNVHGWEDDPGMPGYMPQPDDMGLCIVPQAVSLNLDKSGKPILVGTRKISTGGWWWGIPATSKKAQLAYDFIRFMTSKDVQARECSKFGMIPVRKDILGNLPNVFEQGWVGDIFKVSVEQVKENDLTTVPLVRHYSSIAQLYVDAWYALCVNYDAMKHGKADITSIKMRLASEFSPKVEKILAASDDSVATQ